jgi:hypothetical protein
MVENETCASPPEDLGGALLSAIRSAQWSYDGPARGDRCDSLRQGAWQI